MEWPSNCRRLHSLWSLSIFSSHEKLFACTLTLLVVLFFTDSTFSFFLFTDGWFVRENWLPWILLRPICSTFLLQIICLNEFECKHSRNEPESTMEQRSPKIKYSTHVWNFGGWRVRGVGYRSVRPKIGEYIQKWKPGERKILSFRVRIRFAETRRKRYYTFQSTETLRKHLTWQPYFSNKFPVVSVLRKRNGYFNFQVSVTFPNYGNSLFHPIYIINV